MNYSVPEEARASAQVKGFPTELRARPQWVVWGYEQRDGPKATKVLRIPAGRHLGRPASSTNPTTWRSFEAAQQSLACHMIEGIGYVFAADDPYTGVDLDDCTLPDGTLHPAAAETVRELGSYAERSPSGKGVHVIVRASLPGGRGRRTSATAWGGDLEVYDQARYFTVTGDHLEGSPTGVHDAQMALDGVVERLIGPAGSHSTALRVEFGPEARGVLTDEDKQLLVRAYEANNGERFLALWRGDTSGHGDDHSRADLALVGSLAFWLGGDRDRINRVFRHSGLYREKWDRDDYAARTIDRALDGRDDFYEVGR